MEWSYPNIGEKELDLLLSLTIDHIQKTCNAVLEKLP